MKMIKNKLFENIIALTTIKGLEYLLAFIIFPYLTRTLHADGFGKIIFVQSIINYFVMFTDYGFNLYAPKAIAQNDDVNKRGKIFAGIFGAKIFFLCIATIVFFILILLTNRFYTIDIFLYLVFYLNVIGSVIFPVWFFQGIQQMRYITIVNIVARICCLTGIFYFVQTPDDYLAAAFFQAVVPLIAGICSWIILSNKFKEVFCFPKISDVKTIIKEAKSVFISTLAINSYTSSSIVLLGLFSNSTVVGYYSGAQKIIDNIRKILEPVLQATYPHISKLLQESKEKSKIFIKKSIIVLGGGSFILSIIVFLFAEKIVEIILGTGYQQSVTLLKIMAFLPVIITISNIYGIQILIPLGYANVFSRILVCAAIINLILIFPLAYFYQDIGISICVVIVESFVTLASVKTVKETKFFNIGGELCRRMKN